MQELATSVGCEIVVANQESLSPQQELVEDLMAIIHCFSCRLYGSQNKTKSKLKLAKHHARVAAQRIDTLHKITTYLCKNHAKIVNDVSWGLFRHWLEYFAVKFNSTIVTVNPRITSQKCSDCGIIVKKSLSTRTHKCSCGCELQRDVNAAKNILNLASSTLGHKESNATGVGTTTLVGANLLEQVLTVNVESPPSMYS